MIYPSPGVDEGGLCIRQMESDLGLDIRYLVLGVNGILMMVSFRLDWMSVHQKNVVRK